MPYVYLSCLFTVSSVWMEAHPLARMSTRAHLHTHRHYGDRRQRTFLSFGLTTPIFVGGTLWGCFRPGSYWCVSSINHDDFSLVGRAVSPHTSRAWRSFRQITINHWGSLRCHKARHPYRVDFGYPDWAICCSQSPANRRSRLHSCNDDMKMASCAQ